MQKLTSEFLKYFLLFCVAVLTTATILMIDGYLKCRYAKINPEQAEKYHELNSESFSVFAITTPDYRDEFSFKGSVLWINLICISSFLLVFFAWISRVKIMKALSVS